MQSIILSIKPKFVKKIFSGEKKVEFRKRGFARKVTHIVIYSTVPIKKIVGWFEVDFIYSGHPLVVWRFHNHEATISYKDFLGYYATSDEAVVIGIKNVVQVDEVELSVLGINHPPQSFYYLTKEGFGRVKSKWKP